MSMSGNGMGSEVAAAIEAFGALTGGQTAADIEPLWQAIAGAIVSHIQNNGEINTNVSGNGLPTIPVQVVVATGTGATTAPDTITGSGVGTIA